MQGLSLSKKYLLSFGLALIVAAPSHAASLQVAQERSVFAIVTHKAGIAKGKAHNHFVTAGSYTATVHGEDGGTDGAGFEIDLAADDLVFDEGELQKRWYPRLEALAILSETFAEVSAKDRGKIRASALGKDQLDAEKFPRIQARVTAISEKKTTLGTVDLDHQVMLELEIRGKTVQRALPAQIAWREGELQMEAVGVFRFTEFDIEPFSAFFGAVKNTDEFHLYVNLTAAP